MINKVNPYWEKVFLNGVEMHHAFDYNVSRGYVDYVAMPIVETANGSFVTHRVFGHVIVRNPVGQVLDELIANSQELERYD